MFDSNAKENVKVDAEEEKVAVITLPDIKVSYGKISADFSELKAKVGERVKFYKSLTLTDDNVTAVANARADLNRAAKSLNDYRISMEKDFNKPFEDFKKNVKDVIEVLLDASNTLDVQIKGYEERIKNEKLEKIKELFVAIEEKPYFLELGHIFNKKWLNKTYDFPRIKQDLDLVVLKVKEDGNKLYELAKDSGYEAEMANYYVTQLNYDNVISGNCYSRALAWYHETMERAKQLREAKERAEAEKRAREEEIARQKEAANQTTIKVSGVMKEVPIEKKETEVVEEKRLDIVIQLLNVSKSEAITLDNFLKANNYRYKIITSK